MANKNVSLSITVDDGSRRVPIVNTQGEEIGAFTFRPTDIGIIERFNGMAERFGSITEPLEQLDEGAEEPSEEKLAAALEEAEKRMYAAVNELFGSEDAAAAFFGRMHPFSPVNGNFYCAQVLEQVGAFIGGQFDTETKLLARKARDAGVALSPAVEKYLK